VKRTYSIVMVNLVKIFESLDCKKKFGCDTEKVSQFVKKQLKKSGADLNKLRQLRDTSIHADLRVTPLQIAVMNSSSTAKKCSCWLEILKLLLKTKGVEKNKLATYRKKNGDAFRYSLLDFGTCLSDTPRTEVVKLLLEDVESISLIYGGSDMTCDNLSRVPLCVEDVIRRGFFDVLDLFNSYGSKINDFDPFLSLFAATELNKLDAFKHLLPRAKSFCKHCWTAEGHRILKIAQLNGRTEMCDLLKQAGVSEVCEEIDEAAKVVKDDIVKEETIEVAYDCYKKVCWNCLKTAENVPVLYKCGGCRKARYCQDKCQEEDWDRHELYCRYKTKKRELKLQKRNISPNASEVD